MATVLPTKKLAPTRFNPKTLLVYGDPKIGKTTLINELESCLLCDIEEGATSIESMRVPMKYISGPTVINDKGELTAISFDTIFNDICAQGNEQIAKGAKVAKFPYKRIALDTMDKFQEICEASATYKYKNSTLGKSFDGNSVLELPKGLGYFYLRNEVLDRVEQLSKVCETLILVGHTKDSVINKGGAELATKGIALSGQLASLIFAKADFITYLYREPGKKALMASLEVSEGSVMGTRDFPHLRPLIGTKFPFSWDKILVDKVD